MYTDCARAAICQHRRWALPLLFVCFISAPRRTGGYPAAFRLFSAPVSAPYNSANPVAQHEPGIATGDSDRMCAAATPVPQQRLRFTTGKLIRKGQAEKAELRHA